MADLTEQQEWIDRFRAVAKAQGRYLWLMVVAGLFYLALDAAISEESRPPQQELPLIGIQVDAKVVWSSASCVLGFIALAALGTFQALRYAHERLNTRGNPFSFESCDTEPTAIDFVVYARPGTGGLAKFGLLTYPLFVTLVVGEAGWFWLRLLASKPSSPRDHLFLALGAMMIVGCLYRLAGLWKSKIAQMIKKQS